MVIISKTTIADYGKAYNLAAEPLNNWYAIAQKCSWGNFADIKDTFNSVDSVGRDRYCFNIKGNEYRLIVMISFRVRTIYILWFGTHSEYDKVNKTIGAKKY
ncbi:type II toxin-antitoxin system HigB family toxin [Parasediminibacterium sp. JCM 36343]|uniref:type II toxin-antitoxin system HigB family toxin n=1 Tax=Parasediminibacterium sp. JCM 36343 TaxID=3374279 RepID=UPI00397A386D